MNILAALVAVLAAGALTVLWWQTYGNVLFSYVFIGVTLIAVANFLVAFLEDAEIYEKLKQARKGKE